MESSVIGNVITTNYQRSQHFFTFQENYKINVVIDGVHTNYRCSQKNYFFEKILKSLHHQCNVGYTKYQCSQYFLLFRNKFKNNVVKIFIFLKVQNQYLLFRKIFKINGGNTN
jgi:hypothetical protein